MSEKRIQLSTPIGGAISSAGIAALPNVGANPTAQLKPHGGEDSGLANELHYDDGDTIIDIDGAGIRLQRPTEDFELLIDADGVHIMNTDTGKEILIDPALITEDMGIVEDDVCDSGTARRRLIIASAPFDPA
jgi:hypothetical protein